MVCQMVGANNPEDLDALDELVPISLTSFNNIMGRVLSNEEYNYYYDKFLNNPRHSPEDRQVVQQYFANAREDFRRAVDRNTLPCVRAYRDMLKAGASRAVGAYPPPVAAPVAAPVYAQPPAYAPPAYAPYGQPAQPAQSYGQQPYGQPYGQQPYQPPPAQPPAQSPATRSGISSWFKKH